MRTNDTVSKIELWRLAALSAAVTLDNASDYRNKGLGLELGVRYSPLVP